eukprot:scaffold1395_cov55-Alexandrium_tamarense.AAC.1
MTESEATFSIALAICSCPTACCVGVVGCWRGNGWSSFIVISDSASRWFSVQLEDKLNRGNQ